MKMPTKIALFMLSNTLGIWTAGITVALILIYGSAELIQGPHIPPEFDKWFSVRVMFCALVCLVFSLSGFFLRGKWRLFFLTAPAFIPFIYAAILFASVQLGIKLPV